VNFIFHVHSHVFRVMGVKMPVLFCSAFIYVDTLFDSCINNSK